MLLTTNPSSQGFSGVFPQHENQEQALRSRKAFPPGETLSTGSVAAPARLANQRYLLHGKKGAGCTQEGMAPAEAA